MKINYALQYSQIKKPTWAPPAGLFGPVWTFLYILILISFGYAAYLSLRAEIPTAVTFPFILNLIFNALYTKIQFKSQKFNLAFVDVLLTLLTLVWLMVAIYPYASWVSYINIPYLLWILFATILQGSIAILNRDHTAG